jgi:tRNA-specific 2-thiouridylase
MSRISKKTVFVGMSGGVDSSVAAFLLKKKGYDVVGVFMRCYNIDGCAEKDAEDARRVAEHIGIPFYVWDFEEEYKRKVMDYMIEGYRNGITPNPDVMCNKEVKFGLFLEKALAAGADYVATGHYVRIKRTVSSSPRRRPGSTLPEYSLFEAVDKNKDQSYFLWTLTQDQLKYCLFPIGDYIKPDVRAIARRAGLPTAEKKDSQGICFLGDIPIADFLKQFIPEKHGAIVTTGGEHIGEHQGAEFYTIGQRHLGVTYQVSGIKSGQKKNKNRGRFYVASKDAKTNTVVVAEGSDNPALFHKEVDLTGVHFINPSFVNSIELTNKKNKSKQSVHGLMSAPVPRSRSEGGNKADREIEVYVRVRYRQPVFKARIKCQVSSIKLIFDKPQKFIAPGQSAVFYSKAAQMLGGGVIL